MNSNKIFQHYNAPIQVFKYNYTRRSCFKINLKCLRFKNKKNNGKQYEHFKELKKEIGRKIVKNQKSKKSIF